MRLNVLQSNKWLYFALQVRHPERSEGSPEDGMVFNSEMVRAKNDVPRVMTN